MGSDDPDPFLTTNKPVHTVYVVETFRYGCITEVTNAEYWEFVLAKPDWQKGGIAARQVLPMRIISNIGMKMTIRQRKLIILSFM